MEIFKNNSNDIKCLPVAMSCSSTLTFIVNVNDAMMFPFQGSNAQSRNAFFLIKHCCSNACVCVNKQRLEISLPFVLWKSLKRFIMCSKIFWIYSKWCILGPPVRAPFLRNLVTVWPLWSMRETPVSGTLRLRVILLSDYCLKTCTPTSFNFISIFTFYCSVAFWQLTINYYDDDDDALLSILNV